MSDLFPEARHKELASCPILAMENAALKAEVGLLKKSVAGQKFVLGELRAEIAKLKAG